MDMKEVVATRSLLSEIRASRHLVTVLETPAKDMLPDLAKGENRLLALGVPTSLREPRHWEVSPVGLVGEAGVVVT
ncbi:hypothetical protein PC116_g1211 [Phytophthora cactorum]|uniref:Uncharacterized protein n=1 Tax=Phytophthora cactorum TaxID=29920 RepID=A0A8T1LTK9_9STRA|nr:hypothetical protein Pcac1_g11673 [Phytophthora cactorum]KAG2933095.1 hypothetical protein PC114_g1586 [Phytophthora cactorum]KAG2954661.1 hypothetical protein PC117_g1014 [Phytophthora cactorum]KAG3016031.1 hypothetical protein PC120_g11859 [Phytophthora cactorum]KAG3167342.1 hypothetical protein PC128_g19498 [Phytophthora cactorum]